MLLTLEPLEAHEGDCLLLHWGTVENPRLAIIDGGPGDIYQNSLLPRLKAIRKNRKLPQLAIDLVMVSHVDNDHVVGVKKLFQQLKDEIVKNITFVNRPFTVKRLWHNTFNDILNDRIDQYYQTLTASLQASLNGVPNPLLIQGLQAAYRSRHGGTLSEAEATDIALILAGHAEGRSLRDSFQFLYNANQISPLNAPFQDNNGQPTLIALGLSQPSTTIDHLNFVIVGPMNSEIQALQTAFDAYIKSKGLQVQAVLAAYADKSVPNLSSIVFLVEMNGRRVLLTGDARGDKIIQGLTQAGLLKNGSLKVDILKVPHHGSDRNVTPDFFKQIIADIYVFSGDGKHGNPERDTLTWLTDARGKNAQYTIVLTYKIGDIDTKRKLHAKSWTPATDSLKTFFDSRAQEGYKFSLREGAPFKIELGDEKIAW